MSKDRSSRRVRRCKWYLTPLCIISASLAKATCEIPGCRPFSFNFSSWQKLRWFWGSFLGSLCPCNYSKINSINGVQPTFPPLTAIVWSYLGVPISRFSSVFLHKRMILNCPNHGNNWQSFYGIERGRRPLRWLIPLSYVAYVYEERVASRPRFEMEQAIECSSYFAITVRKSVWFSSENRNRISPFVGADFQRLLLFFCP